MTQHTNYVYKQTESGLWTVGFYGPDGKWEPESDHSSGIVEGEYKEGSESAAERAHYLNGGNSPGIKAELAQLRQDKAELVEAAEKLVSVVIDMPPLQNHDLLHRMAVAMRGMRAAIAKAGEGA